MISFTLSTFNTLNYLKLAVKSVRQNSFYTDAPFIIHAENCTDGTNEWLLENKDVYNLEVYIEENETPRGIGGGMNFCASKVQTKYIGFLSSDFWMAKDWDKPLVEICEQNANKNVWAFSYRVEPDIFNDPVSRPGVLKVDVDTFGEFHHNFDNNSFDVWSSELSLLNNIEYNIPMGVSGIISKEAWDYIGGNDDRFAPMYWEDADIFVRMINEGYEFILTSNSLVWHFGARGSHRLEENNGQTSQRQKESEQKNIKKWLAKWGKLPIFDQYGMITKFN